MLARLERENARPAEEAPRETLIRRLYLDLIGLPPTVEDVEQFVHDPDPAAYEKLVEHLLASPHYGERWARHWLDVARYADTGGLDVEVDFANIWRYRDWVIRAFNRDLPLDQFAMRQLAGDLAPQATDADRIATGFLRCSPHVGGGGMTPEESRYNLLGDWVDTLSQAFLGLTLDCARCHKHRFDPISQGEYYRLYAFFDTAQPHELALDPSVQKQLNAFNAQARQFARLRDHLAGMSRPDQEAYERCFREAAHGWRVQRPVRLDAAEGTVLSVEPDGSILATGPNPAAEQYTLVFDPGEGLITGLRLEVLTDDRLPHGGPGRSEAGTYLLTELEVAATVGAADAAVKIATAVCDEKRKFTYRVLEAIDGRADRRGWSNYTPDEAFNVERRAVFEFVQPIPAQRGSRLIVRLRQAGEKNSNLGRFRIAFTGKQGPLLAVSPDLARLLTIPWEKRDETQHAQVRAGLQVHSQGVVDSFNYRKADLLKVADTARVVADYPTAPTRVFVRGDWRRPGERVERGIPDVLPPLDPANASPTRVDLVNWLFQADHPLTSRVLANRQWQEFFGRGLVETTNDFGAQGTPPTHPELLDWLACYLRDHGWRQKSLHRLIVTSATYRQDSRQDSELVRRDPTNQWLARQQRLRLPAEVIRDQALAVSGLLARRCGGPSVFPHQPEGVAAFGANANFRWVASAGADRYRRAMYTFFKRSAPHPFLTLLDAPEATAPCTRRERTNTPLQALALLNDQTMIDCAHALACRARREAPPDEAARLRWLFRQCVLRLPTAREEEILRGLLRDHGDASRAAATAEAVEVEAWADVCRVILNLDAFINRENR